MSQIVIGTELIASRGHDIYNTFLQKKEEADIVKAANLSYSFYRSGKDVGGGQRSKNVRYYVLALFWEYFSLLFVFLFFINNSIQNTDDIGKLTKS
jgi:NADH:ubiquinone oxidoreductase subunit 3 (subunit A)